MKFRKAVKAANEGAIIWRDAFPHEQYKSDRTSIKDDLAELVSVENGEKFSPFIEDILATDWRVSNDTNPNDSVSSD